MLLLPWPALLSIAAGLGALSLFAYLWRHRGQPGANWFLVAIAAQALWCLSYGVSLLVFDPTIRLGLEMVTWIGMLWTGVPFLAFGLEYTGRGRFVRTPWFGLVLAVPALLTVFVLTNPLHELVWHGFQLDPVFGAATVRYEFGGVGVAAVLLGTVAAAAGTLVLVETVISYGPLYRTEALAVALSTVPPGAGLLLWMFGVGPVPQLNLAVMLFLPHVLLDAYAFVGSGMFRFNPATRRTADQSAIDDLENPFVVVNTDDRIVDLNPAAARTFDLESPAVLGEPLTSATGLDLEIEADGEADIVTHETRERFRKLSVSTAELRGPSDKVVGYTVLFQDVTGRQRRKQRLEILNRILRHNLRNDLNVIQGYVDIATDRIDDDDAQTVLENARTDVSDLIGLTEKAWAFEQALDEIEETPRQLSPHAVLDETAADVERAVGGTVIVDVPEALVLRSQRRLLRQLFFNLAENGIEHTDEQNPTVTIAYEGSADDGRTAVFSVSDFGPGIPDHELAVLERGEETALEHGSGLGLWITTWCTRTLGGELQFDVDDGTTAFVHVPGVVDAANGRRDDSKQRPAASKPYS